MADRNVRVLLDLITKGFEDGAKKAESSAKGLLDTVEKNDAALSTLSNTMIGAGVGILAGVGLAVKSFADFDRQMSAVKSTGADAVANFDALRDAAIEAGASTAFSAVEAAQGIEELAKAGLSASDILNGGLAGALDLAAAGTISVGNAAEITAVTLQQFGLSGEHAAHVADLLAAGAAEAVGGVEDIAAALKMSGTVANQFGISIEETVGSLAMFASNALIGSDAGTSMKQMLLQLAQPTGKARQLLDEYNISAYDAQGNFVGMASLAGQLKEQLGGLSQEQQNAALKTIFGADAIRTATILMNEGAEGVEKWTAAVNQQGYAAEMAKMKLDNLAGDLEELGGAFETAFIRAGSGMNDFVRGAVQGLTGFVNLIGGLPGPVLSVATAIAGLAGASLVGVGGLIKLVQTGAELRTSLKTLNDAFPKLSEKIGAIGWGKALVGAAALAGLLYTLHLAAQQNVADFDALTSKAEDLSAKFLDTGNAAKTLNDAFTLDTQGLFSGVTREVDGLGDALQRVLAANPGQQFEDFFNGLITGRSAAEQMRLQFVELDKSMASLAQGGNTAEAARLFDEVTRAAEQQGIPLETVAALFPSYAGALRAAAGESGNAKTNMALLAEGLGEVGDEAETASLALVKLGNAFLALSGSHMGYEASLDAVTAAIKENGKATLDAAGAIDISSEKGRNLQGALDSVAKSALSVIDNMLKTGEATANVSAFQQRAAGDFLDSAAAMGVGTAQAIELAAKYKLIPNNVVTAVTAPGLKLTDKETRDLTQALMAVPRLTEATVLAPGARPSKADVDAFVRSIGSVPGMTTAQIRTIADLYGVEQAKRAIAGVQGKTVQVVVNYRAAGVSNVRIATAQADGGMLTKQQGALVQAYASGGLHSPRYVGSIGSRSPGIYPYAGPGGVIMNEEGSGPWELIVSGHPGKRSRSRMLLEHGARLLGGNVSWASAYADGGMHYAPSYLPPPVVSRSSSPGHVTVSLDGAVIRATVDGTPLDLRMQGIARGELAQRGASRRSM